MNCNLSARRISSLTHHGPSSCSISPAAHGVACYYLESDLPDYTAYRDLRINCRTAADIDQAVANRCLKADTIDELLGKIDGMDVDTARSRLNGTTGWQRLAMTNFGKEQPALICSGKWTILCG